MTNRSRCLPQPTQQPLGQTTQIVPSPTDTGAWIKEHPILTVGIAWGVWTAIANMAAWKAKIHPLQTGKMPVLKETI